jgi:polyisoprenoid-binding protein YceI
LLRRPQPPAPSTEARPADGRIVVNVFKKGLFSAFAHDHHFEVSDWRATAAAPEGDPSAASVDVVLSAGSLRDTQRALSDEDRRKVDTQAAGPNVLDAAHHPQIEFRSERIELTPSPAAGTTHARGTIHGTLTLRGRSVPTDVRFEAEQASGAWRVRGTARVKQSDFGIKPFSGFGGTVRVKDEMSVDISLTLRPKAD